MIFKRKKEELLSPDSAGHMLQNIFEACDVEPNTVPLEDLEAYSNYRRDKFTIQKVAIAVIIVIFLLVPALFVAPVLSLNPVQNDSNGISYNLSVNSLIPISNVSAELNGNKVPVYQTDEGIYSIEPDANGELLIKVSLLNKQYDSISTQVTTVDADYDTPVLDSYEKLDGKLIINLSDEKSGIDYSGIYAESITGDKTKPDVLDDNPKKGKIAFEYNNESLNIFLPDKAGNTLQLVLTAQ